MPNAFSMEAASSPALKPNLCRDAIWLQDAYILLVEQSDEQQMAKV